jgi:hypothetical protein
MGRSGASVAGIAVLMVLACGSGGDVGSLSEGYRGKAVPSSAPLPPAGAWTVPPDRALVPVSIVAPGDDFAAAAAALRGRIEAVASAGAAAACEVRVVDYTPPHRAPRGELQAQADLVADVSLVGLATVVERMDRLDACLTALRSAAPEDQRSIGAAELRVDAPEASFDPLAVRFAADQARAASVAGAQAHPEDRRCVPSGRVLVKRPRLSGVELELDVECRIERSAAPGI